MEKDFNMEAIVLAGGLGTRLRGVISDVPKPMAPIGNKPFLWYIFEYLYRNGISRVILSVGYKYESITNYFGDMFKNMSIVYSVESEPLGTGGAIKKAFGFTKEQSIFIINGDTLFNVNLKNLQKCHLKSESFLTLSLKPMAEFDRYGIVLTDNSCITGFEEKGFRHSGNINGGIYLANTDVFNSINLSDKFSFETDFLMKYHTQLNFNCYISNEYFIDIGIPDDYRRAQKELPKVIYE